MGTKLWVQLPSRVTITFSKMTKILTIHFRMGSEYQKTNGFKYLLEGSMHVQ